MKPIIFKTILLACLVTGLPGLFFACKKDSDNGTPIGGGTVYEYYKLKSFTAKNGDKSVTSGEAKASVKKEDYFIGVINEVEMTSKPQASVSIPFINAAYAAHLIRVNVDTVKSVKIITLKDFDANHPAGSDVTDKFGAAGGDKTLNDWELLRFFSSDLTRYDFPFLPVYLKVSPETGIKAAQFKVVYTLDSGRQLEATTPEVDLL
ncbi:MAG: DUF5034 domain-containing protein [Niabella sp.]